MFALGEFDFTGNFAGNTDNMIIFWLLFFIGTLISLLIILNMVIAVMGNTFERVDQQTESHVMRSKLDLISHNHYRLYDFYRQRFRN